MKRYAGIFSLYSSGNRYIKDIIEGYTIIKMKKSAPLLFNLIFIDRRREGLKNKRNVEIFFIRVFSFFSFFILSIL